MRIHFWHHFIRDTVTIAWYCFFSSQFFVEGTKLSRLLKTWVEENRLLFYTTLFFSATDNEVRDVLAWFLSFLVWKVCWFKATQITTRGTFSPRWVQLKISFIVPHNYWNNVLSRKWPTHFFLLLKIGSISKWHDKVF